jgi:hypothetical protein
MNLTDELIHEHPRPRMFFGKVKSAVAPFLHNSQLLVVHQGDEDQSAPLCASDRRGTEDP